MVWGHLYRWVGPPWAELVSPLCRVAQGAAAEPGEEVTHAGSEVPVRLATETAAFMGRNDTGGGQGENFSLGQSRARRWREVILPSPLLCAAEAAPGVLGPALGPRGAEGPGAPLP